MHLEIVTPDKKVFQGEVTEATFPGADGSFQVLKNHAPIIAGLGEEVVSFTRVDRRSSRRVSGGLAEVKEKKSIVSVEEVTDNGAKKLNIRQARPWMPPLVF